jgi:hypothetical protein
MKHGAIKNLPAKSFPVILSDASSSLAKKVAESKDRNTAGFPSPPHGIRTFACCFSGG